MELERDRTASPTQRVRVNEVTKRCPLRVRRVARTRPRVHTVGLSGDSAYPPIRLNDDCPREMADVVSLRVDGNDLIIRLDHSSSLQMTSLAPVSMTSK